MNNIELRWVEREYEVTINSRWTEIRKERVLQYRERFFREGKIEGDYQEIGKWEWSDWRDVPVETEEA